MNDVTVTVLVMQRESRRAHEVPNLLRECGYVVGARAHTRNEVLKELQRRDTQWHVLLIDLGTESQIAGNSDPRHTEFLASAQAVMREMSLRQILLPVVAVSEDKSTDAVVRTMRLGVVDALLPPFTKGKMKGLLRCAHPSPTLPHKSFPHARLAGSVVNGWRRLLAPAQHAQHACRLTACAGWTAPCLQRHCISVDTC